MNKIQKIKTMKDDLDELEKKLDDSSRTKEPDPAVIANLKKQEIPETKNEPEQIGANAAEPAGNEPSSEANELKDLVSRVSKTLSEKQKVQTDNSPSSVEENMTPAPISRVSPRTSKTDDLENIISRFTKLSRQEQSEKNLPKVAEEELVENMKEIKKASGKAPEKTEIKNAYLAPQNEPLEKKKTETEKTENEQGEVAIDEEINKSGILLREKTEKKEDEKEKNKEKKHYAYLEDKDYMAPENRLILGKQEYYSSIAKKIDPKKEKDELKGLKNADVIKEEKQILSDQEEYKKLKQKIIKKYHIKLFSLPWIKIILTGLIIVASSAGIVYYLLSKIPSDLVNPFNPPVYGTELPLFANIKNKLETTKDKAERIDLMETEAFGIFSSDKNIDIVKLNIKDKDRILPLEESLKAIKVNTGYFPQNFSVQTSNDYNLFLFKTKKNSLRLGLAVKVDNAALMEEIMKKWEGENAENKIMFNVFKRFFIDDKIVKEASKSFASSSYKNTAIRYIHLPNQDTALNYFIRDNILVISTSKESALKIIDLMLAK